MMATGKPYPIIFLPIFTICFCHWVGQEDPFENEFDDALLRVVV